MKKTLIVNFFGGPGCRKSTMASRIFSELKDQGINCEFATEYAKDVTWQKGFHILSNQLYIFAKQQHRIWRLDGQVDVIVTDSPLLQSLAYSEGMSTTFKMMVVEESLKRPSLNILLERVGKYDPIGRNQTEEEAVAIDKSTRANVERHANLDLVLPGEKDSVPVILNAIFERLKELKEPVSEI
jgi:hypothetical protein